MLWLSLCVTDWLANQQLGEEEKEHSTAGNWPVVIHLTTSPVRRLNKAEGQFAKLRFDSRDIMAKHR
jgi:hypothetical protein